MFRAVLTASVAAFALSSAALTADDPGKPLRLLVDAPTIGDAGPAHLVIDAWATKGDEAGQTDVKGWFSALPPLTGSGPIKGKCAEQHCRLSLSGDYKFLLSGDLLGLAGPAAGKFEIAGDEDLAGVTGAASFAPFTDAIPGVGILAKADAVDAATLDNLLSWDSSGSVFGDSNLLDNIQREELALWQTDSGRPSTGLLTTADLDLLVSQRAEKRKALGWATLGAAGQGWTAGYPAALLPNASRTGHEQKFASADGAASLVIAIDPPMSNEAFSALPDKLKQERPEVNYEGGNDELKVDYVENGKAVVILYRNRAGGLLRMVYTHPDGDNPYTSVEPRVVHELMVSDDLKPGS